MTWFNNIIQPFCLHLRWDGERDGEYEPYVKHSYPLDSDLVLRGIPKLDSGNNLYYDGDTYESDGTVTRRYGIVDLGTLTWNYSSSDNRFDVTLNSIPDIAGRTVKMICSKYPCLTNGETFSASWNNVAYGGYRKIYVHDHSYNDPVAFKTAMSGVYLVYELATPTTEEAEPFAYPQICDDFGTEEYVTTSIVPVGHETKYIPNLRDKLRHLPEPTGTDGNYIVHEAGEKLSLVPPPAEIPAPPTTDGTYTLKATVSSGNATLTWVSE